MNTTARLLIPSMSYTYSMMIGFIFIGICFLCTLCCILTRIVYEREKRERKITNLHRLMINFPEIDLNELKGNFLKEKDLPLIYGQMMIMLGKSINEIDEFKKQLQTLPISVAEKLGNFTKTDQNERRVQRTFVENQFRV